MTARDAAADRVDVALGTGLAAVCLTLYVRTLTPGLPFPNMDSHELTLNVVRLGVPHPSGYPLYTWLAHAFVRVVAVGDAAWRVNLFSAVSAAAAVACLHVVAREAGAGRLAAAFGTLFFGVATTFWSQAVISEVYATDVAMQAATTLLLLRWARRVRAGGDGSRRFVGFALVFGLSLGTHLSNLGFAPAYALFVLLTSPGILARPREIAAAFAAFVIGVAQYVWLPLRGGLFDQFPNVAPTDLARVWRYTFGAFSELRFAYPLATLPVWLMQYVQLLTANFGAVGVALGVLGAWNLLGRRPATFWLVFGIHVTNLCLFVDFAAPDIDVFFVPGYVAWAVFVAFGVDGVVEALVALRARLAPRSAAGDRVVTAAVGAVLAVAVFAVARDAFHDNDRRGDTVVPDFDRNVLDLLPERSWVTGARGAYGADLPYWQVAHGLRPDVTILGQQGATPWPGDAPLYTTVRMADGRPTPNGLVGQSLRDLPPDGWYVPVLFGNAYALRLARIDAQPPPLVVETATPATRVARRLGRVELIGATVTIPPRAPSPRLHVESWWQVPDAGHVVVQTRIDETTLEAHELGLDNLARYAATVGLAPGALVHEGFDVVVPSRTARGSGSAAGR